MPLTINGKTIGGPKPIEPIVWEPYKGETVNTHLTIRNGERIQETAFYEDRVKAVPRGNAYCIGNGPSRKVFDLNRLEQQVRHTDVMHFTEISFRTISSQ